jgi:phosphomannomutase/phosphoglucomutase
MTSYKLLAQQDIPASIFRAYDIRGVVDETLNADIVYSLGVAIGNKAQTLKQNKIIVARDGRVSGPELLRALQAGLQASGCDVIDIGAVPTPVLYFATHTLATNSGIMLTGSHNPTNYNGLKIVLAGTTLADTEIFDIYNYLARPVLSTVPGQLTPIELANDYINHIRSIITPAKPLKVVADCGNGIAGAIAPQLFSALGCELIPLYCEVDGRFPNHHPDPSNPDNLSQLINQVEQHKADLGFAFDGDGDRLGLVTNTGEIIWPDRQLMLFATDLLSRHPQADIIYDVKCSRHLERVIKQQGGNPIMWKTGHSLIKAKMRESQALLAGEMSGHVFCKENWFGFDDALYAAAKLLEIVAADSRTISEIFKTLPDSLNTPELKLPIKEEQKFAFIDRLITQGDFSAGKITTIDGLRVDFIDGWGLIRASNTTPNLILRFEADDAAALNRIQKLFREQLLSLEAELALPF